MKPNLTNSELLNITENKRLDILFTERIYTDYYPIITENNKQKKFGKICDVNLNFNIQDNQTETIQNVLIEKYGLIDKFYFIK
jgi:hypothetical protein